MQLVAGTVLSTIAAIVSFTLGTELGTDAYFKCSGDERQFACCRRIFNTTLNATVNLGCVTQASAEAPQCPYGTSLTCIDGSVLSTPTLQPSPGWVGGIVSATIFWAMAHGFVAAMWFQRHSYELITNDDMKTCFRTADCTNQGWKVFTRYFLTTMISVLDLGNIIGAFSGWAYPKRAVCKDGMTCCDSVACPQSLSVFQPSCTIGMNLECVSGNTLQDVKFQLTPSALALGIIDSVMLGLSTAYAFLLGYTEWRMRN